MSQNADGRHRYSELLAPYLEGRLGDAEAREVEQHLEACAECSAEREALEALRGGAPAGMDDLERARLHRAIEVGTGTSFGRRKQESSRRAWLGGALGAAALVAIAAVAIVSAGGNLFPSGNDSGAGGSAALDSNEREQQDAGGAREGFANDAPHAVANRAREPLFDRDAGKLSVKQLKGLRRKDAVRSFAGYSAPEARGRQDRFLELLAKGAPVPQRARLRACAQVVLTNYPGDYSILPTFGALGRLDGRPVLVLAFVYSTEDRGKLRKYMVWAWQPESCQVPVLLQDGLVKP